MDPNAEESYAKNSLTYKAFNVTRTLGNWVNHMVHIVPGVLSSNPDILDFTQTQTKIWKGHSEGLYVVIHGLNGNPYTLGVPIANSIRKNKDMDSYDVVVPLVPNKGNCALHMAARPIYNLIIDYIDHNPTKPIHLICASNGCRIGSFIECKLRYVDINIRVTALVGAYGGSRLVEKYPRVLSSILHTDVLSDLKLNSDVNNNLKQQMMKPVVKGTRSYEFYRTANDWLIPNINDCFPDVNATEVVYHDLAEGIDHVGLGYYKIEEILDNSLKWMRDNDTTEYKFIYN